MPIMDVFLGDAFTARSLTTAIDRYSYVPGFLETIPGLFEDRAVRTPEIFIEERDFAPALIQTSPRGAPPHQESGDKRKVRAFSSTRIADSSRVWAHEIQGIRPFGQEVGLKDLQMEIGRRQMKIKNNFALTKENMRFGCVTGVVVDADGSTIYSWFDEFGVSAPTETVFDFSSAATEGDIIKACNAKRRSMVRSLKGLGGANVTIHALCGDDFWDAFVTSAEVRKTYQYAMAAKDLQNDVGGAWESFRFGKIMWHNYRGTDDQTTLAVGAKKAKFFPAGAGIFQVAKAPAERFEFVNTPGLDEYSWVVPDKDRDSWADVEVYSYPLHVCTMPQALDAAKIN
ncbi:MULTISPECIES: major capsid protein [Methylosinus]|uniref:Minor capsid protein E n=1 Tax=Methylosinus trichosporium (strain ATCC 35070 / NCIMB 11131 / UNIQEM 75 / OB3b) TaxID=595536 RepID=A0A2D2CYJ1_METT3|nr:MULTISPECIES: major capsid protein [Methylosinus]ATQ67813.1 minor capsid protein E [Methylosinus trichosporium OB3b]MBY6239813.1 major capsid protein [Methylosinus sp. Sm6]OBS51834.1 major capsid protein E [Methylosinus sp. 3S-1]